MGNSNTKFWEEIDKQENFVRKRIKEPDSQILLKKHSKKCVEAVLRQEYNHTRFYKANTYINNKDIVEARKTAGKR